MKSATEVHRGVIHCIKYIKEGYKGNETLFSGGSDQMIQITDPKTMIKITELGVEGIPRSVDFSKYLLIGLRNGFILECDIEKVVKETVMVTHHMGEVWGLCVIDQACGLEEASLFVTSCDDNRILMYDMVQKKCIQRGQVKPNAEETVVVNTKIPKIGDAFSTSNLPAENQSRALAWNKKMNHLAVAHNNGGVDIREVSFEKGSDLNKIIKKISDSTRPKDWVECMSYNAPCTRLAVASHDNNIYIYSTPNYHRQTILKGHTCFITCFDWTTDGDYIRSVCGGHELLYFDLSKEKPKAILE